MIFEIHSECEAGGQLYHAWCELADSPLEHPGWLLNWWNTFGRGNPRRELTLVAVHDNNRIVAIAPLFRDGGKLRLIGSGKVCTDHQQLLIGDTSATREFVNWLLTEDPSSLDFDQIDLESIDQDCVTDEVLRQATSGEEPLGLLHSLTDVGSCQIRLPSDWDAYLKTLSRNHRKRCRRWHRKYFDSGRIEVLSTSSGWDWASAFRVLVDLHGQRRDDGVFTDARFMEFLQNAFISLAPDGLAEISAIVLDGEIVAVEFELVGDETVFAYQSGIASAAEENSPGSLSLMYRIRSAMESGKTVYDFMRGVEGYKSRWAATPQPAARLKIWRATMSGKIAKSSSLFLDRTKCLVRDFVSSA